jgi:hypothetical protein
MPANVVFGIKPAPLFIASKALGDKKVASTKKSGGKLRFSYDLPVVL